MFALVDCNNFYVSCERVFNPKLLNRPVIVLSNNDGCVVARSDEAKKIGIRMAQPAFLMADFLKQNNVAVLSSNYVLYGDMSERVMQTIKTMVPEVEVYSIDEMFLSLSGITCNNWQKFAKRINDTVTKHTGIPVSIGIAPTKTLAKAANYFAKKQKGIFILQTPDEIKSTLVKMPVEEVWGIGEQITRVLNNWKLTNAWQLRCLYDNWVRKTFNVNTLRTVLELRGISCIPLEEMPTSRKNICIGRSFGSMTSDYSVIKEATATFAARCAEKLRSQNLKGRLVTVFIETNPFREDLAQYNRLKVFPMIEASNFTPDIVNQALCGLKSIYKDGYLYKKAGVMVSDMTSAGEMQTNLFVPQPCEQNKKLMETIDLYNKRFGRDSIRVAAMGFDRKWWLRQEKLSKRYTTQWEEVVTIYN